MTNTFKGIEHIGLVVPDVAQAQKFFSDAFGATVLFTAVDPDGDNVSGQYMNPINRLRLSSEVEAIVMMRIGSGPNLELFQIANPGRTDQPRFEDFGVQHFSIYCDDMETAARQLEKAGALLLDGPIPGGGPEEGEGNFSRFAQTPWGLVIEFNHMPSPMQYDEGASQTRYFPK